MRLRPGDRELARTLFALMAEVFEEPCEALSERYLDSLPARPRTCLSPQTTMMLIRSISTEHSAQRHRP
jgi:hypothetical protein